MKKDLNIELFLLCFNEAKMIKHTLNYYSKICSKITIYDNESTDNSREIIKEYDESIEIKSFSTNGQYREDIMIDLRNNCWKESTADYVIVCDMDEFLYTESLLEKLVEAKDKGVAIPIITGYNMVASEFPTDYSTPIMDQIKHGLRDQMFDKKIILDPKKVKSMNYGPGSHVAEPEFFDSDYEDVLLKSELKLLHYKFIDKDLLYIKHKSYSDRMSDINKENKWGEEYNRGNAFIDKVFVVIKDHIIKVV